MRRRGPLPTALDARIIQGWHKGRLRGMIRKFEKQLGEPR